MEPALAQELLTLITPPTTHLNTAVTGWGMLIGAVVSIREAERLGQLSTLDPEEWNTSTMMPDLTNAFFAPGHFDPTTSPELIRWTAGYYLNIAQTRVSVALERMVLHFHNPTKPEQVRVSMRKIIQKLVTHGPFDQSHRNRQQIVDQTKALHRLFNESQANQYQTFADIESAIQNTLNSLPGFQKQIVSPDITQSLLAVLPFTSEQCLFFTWEVTNEFKHRRYSKKRPRTRADFGIELAVATKALQLVANYWRLQF